MVLSRVFRAIMPTKIIDPNNLQPQHFADPIVRHALQAFSQEHGYPVATAIAQTRGTTTKYIGLCFHDPNTPQNVRDLANKAYVEALRVAYTKRSLNKAEYVLDEFTKEHSHDVQLNLRKDNSKSIEFGPMEPVFDPRTPPELVQQGHELFEQAIIEGTTYPEILDVTIHHRFLTHERHIDAIKSALQERGITTELLQTPLANNEPITQIGLAADKNMSPEDIAQANEHLAKALSKLTGTKPQLDETSHSIPAAEPETLEPGA